MVGTRLAHVDVDGVWFWEYVQGLATKRCARSGSEMLSLGVRSFNARRLVCRVV